jgi:hypothetical protein
MAKTMIECPVCRDENWNFVHGKFVCSREREHTPDQVTNAVLRYADKMVLAKTKLAFVADMVGPGAVWEMDERIVTLLYADGARFAIKIQEVRGDATVVTVSVNGMTVGARLFPTDTHPARFFALLTGYSPEEFDAALVERLSGGRLTASAHR